MNAVVALLPARPAGTNTTCANTIFANDLEQLYNALNDVTLTEHARTAELMNAGLRKISPAAGVFPPGAKTRCHSGNAT